MCKVLMLSNTSKLTNVKKTVDTIFDLITHTDDHGFGYAFRGKNGVFGEKTINKTWKYGSKTPEFAKTNVTDEKFGTPSNISGAALFHGRTSTNHINLLNTHPLQKNDWTLIHNGVVNNQGPAYEMVTTNDTEHLVHYLSTEGIRGIEQHITGYYAIGAIDPEGKLHIVRDGIASLYACFSDTIKSWIFATTVDLIKDLCEQMEWTRGTIREYDKGMYTIMDKNNIELVQEFTPRGFGYAESKYASQSLGRSIGSGYGRDYDYEDSYNMHRRTNRDVTIYKDGKVVDSEADLEDSINEARMESYSAFLEEVANMDSSYMIEDENGREISTREFDKLDMIAQAKCKIVRADGTIVDPDDYYTEKLA